MKIVARHITSVCASIAIVALVAVGSIRLRLELLEPSHVGQVSTSGNGKQYKQAAASILRSLSGDPWALEHDIQSNNGTSIGLWDFLTNDGILNPPPPPRRPLLKSSSAVSPMKNWKLLDTIIRFTRNKAHQMAKAALGMIIKLDSKSLNKGFQLVMKRLADLLGWAIAKTEKLLDNVLQTIETISRGNRINNDEQEKATRRENPELMKMALARSASVVTTMGALVGSVPFLSSLYAVPRTEVRDRVVPSHLTFEYQRRLIEVGGMSEEEEGGMRMPSATTGICSAEFNHLPPLRYAHAAVVGMLVKEAVAALAPNATLAKIVWSNAFGGTQISANSERNLVVAVVDLSVALSEVFGFAFGVSWFAWELSKLALLVSVTFRQSRASKDHRDFALPTRVGKYTPTQWTRICAVCFALLGSTQGFFDYSVPTLMCVSNGLLLAAVACVIRSEVGTFQGVVRRMARGECGVPLPSITWPALALVLGCASTLTSGVPTVAFAFMFYALATCGRLFSYPRGQVWAAVPFFVAVTYIALIVVIALLAASPLTVCEDGERDTMQTLSRRLWPPPSPNMPADAFVKDTIVRWASAVDLVGNPQELLHIASHLALFPLGAVLLTVLVVSTSKATTTYCVEMCCFEHSRRVCDEDETLGSRKRNKESLTAREGGIRPEALRSLASSVTSSIDMFGTVLVIFATGRLLLANSHEQDIGVVSCALVALFCIQWVTSGILAEFASTPGVGLDGVSIRYLDSCRAGFTWIGGGLLAAHVTALPFALQAGRGLSWLTSYQHLVASVALAAFITRLGAHSLGAATTQAALVIFVAAVFVQPSSQFSSPAMLAYAFIFVLQARLLVGLGQRLLAFS